MSTLFIVWLIFVRCLLGEIPSDNSIDIKDLIFRLFCFAVEISILFNRKGFEINTISSLFVENVFDKYKEKVRKFRFAIFALMLVLWPFLKSLTGSAMIWYYFLFFGTIDTEIALVLSTSEERKTYFQTKEGRRFKGIAIFIIAAFMFSYIYLRLFQ